MHCPLAHLSSSKCILKTTHFPTVCYQQTEKDVDWQTCCAKVVRQYAQNLVVNLRILQPAGLVAAEAAHSTGCSGPMLNAAAFCAGVTRPISTAICLGISALLRKKLQRH